MNAYQQLETVRDMIAEASASHWSDRELLSAMNVEQRRIGIYVGLNAVSWLLDSVAVTPTSSVITLPANCAKPVYLEETSSGSPVQFSTNVQNRRVSRTSGVDFSYGIKEAYPQRNVIVVNSESYSTACTLWYLRRVPDLHVGTASAGGATSITLSAHDGASGTTGFGAKVIADYYNNVGIEIVSGTGAGAVDTITDYTAARVATVTGTYSSDSVYGTISLLPDETHELITLGAVKKALAKRGSSIDPKYYQYIADEWKVLNAAVIDFLSSRVGTTTRILTTEADL